jgi:hypothetical protein
MAAPVPAADNPPLDVAVPLAPDAAGMVLVAVAPPVLPELAEPPEPPELVLVPELPEPPVVTGVVLPGASTSAVPVACPPRGVPVEVPVIVSPDPVCPAGCAE